MSGQGELPAIFHHSVEVWNAMQKESAESGDYWEYEGYLTQLFRKHHFPVPYYTSVRQLLLDLDCIRQLRRGGGSAKSKYLLIRPPTPVLYFALKDRPSASAPKPKDILDQRLNDMNNRLLAVEAKVANL